MRRDDRRGGPQFFGRDGFGRNGFGRGNDRRNERGDRKMYKAVCGNCGRDCEIPFQPRNDKPIYCDECFAKMKGRDGGRSESRRFGGERPSRGGSDQYRGQFENLNAKLDKILKLLDPKNESNNKKENLVESSVQEQEVVNADPTSVQEEVKPKKRKTSKKEEVKEDSV